MKKILIIIIFLAVSNFANAQFFVSSYEFTKADSIKCKILSKDWRGNIYMEFKNPDTTVVKIKVFDSNGYVKRIKAYRLVGAKRLIVAEGDTLYWQSNWSYELVSYLYMNKHPIKDDDIDFN